MDSMWKRSAVNVTTCSLRISRLFFASRFVRTISGGGLRIQSSKPMVKFNDDIPIVMVTYNSQASQPWGAELVSTFCILHRKWMQVYNKTIIPNINKWRPMKIFNMKINDIMT